VPREVAPVPWPEWIALFGAVLVAVAGGSWIGDWLAASTRRTFDTQTAHVEDVRRATAALVEYASLVSKRNNTGDQALDDEMRRASNELEATVAMVRTADYGVAVLEYVRLAELFASRDPDTSEATERDAFRRLLADLRSARLAKVTRRR
jgi:hypothetical protein